MAKKKLLDDLESNVSQTKKKEKEDKTKNLIDSIYGELLEMTDDEDHFFPSGSLIIDSVISNGSGIPLGKFISINSNSGVGKSSMCLHIARNCCAKGYRCLYIDTECGLNRSQLDSFSMLPFVENRSFITKYIRTYRELDAHLGSLFKDGVLRDPDLKFIFIDSLTDIIPDQYIESNISDINQPALDARMQGIFLRKYKSLFAKAGVTVFFILQNRTKIAMAYGQHTTVQASGGLAVAYHMDITLDLSLKEFLVKTIKGHDRPVPYGSECFLMANKNRYAPPKIPMQVQIIFGKGVSNSGAIANALILNGLVRTPTKSKYVIDYKGEETTHVSKAKFDAFIKEHLDYYKEIVERCGGIKLIPDTEVIQPVSDTETEMNNIEEVDGGDIEDFDTTYVETELLEET